MYVTVYFSGCKQPQGDSNGAVPVRQSVHPTGRPRKLTRTGGGGIHHCAQRSQYDDVVFWI